ncbi:GntR family transcriptional regulator [Sphaerisporangium sp. TRM90804]|uniref:GntR family transcriptional regulator n=1 Tax=Sphaerisporangium sp. TRM90804 TaxID=3031113 RepID=UPI0024477C74|nr:GntR family transcriptional regulator [Sphaerisporangium sp. TRM90804]MDH2430556.1 GntR family transcriptional regulator [Sphaerisporangium sp. TRM90804]
MLLTIDLDSDVPIYQQIRDRVVEAIADGELREGSALPSTRQLAADLAINFHTVNKAYDLLRRQNVIRINRKSGAVVRRDAASGPPGPGFADDWEPRLRTLFAEAAVHGMDPQEVLRRSAGVLDSFAPRRETPV